MSVTFDRAGAYRVFFAALDVAPAQRAAFIAAQCGDSAELRQMVERLLALTDTDMATTGALLGDCAAQQPDRIGSVYGHFRLLELLGSGGMGTVYRAERADGVPQMVAVKLLREGIGAASSAQFLREARLLARLEHPSIARLIDVGIHEGTGWIAMEFVRGMQLSAYCDAHQLDVAARVQLLLVVTDAVATAHRRLVVHRDIKPTNVLVTDDGQPKLIDFGIAATLKDPAELREPTMDIRRLFTPHYAAPEQVRGEPATVATDVFGLGALAYRVLCGREPFANATSAVGYLLAVTADDVEPPSHAAAAAGADRTLIRRLRGDLDSIISKALERDPARRYRSVEELQADLRAYLDGRPVRAHGADWVYRCAKFLRRRALPVSLAALVVLGLAAGSVIYALQERRVSQARDAAARRGEFLEQLLKSANPSEGRRDITVAELLDSAGRTLDQTFGSEPLVEASMLGVIAETNVGLGRYEEALAASDRQLAVLQSNSGSDLELARALITRGELLRAHTQYAQGVPVLRRAVALLARLSGVDADKGAALNELGMVLANTGAEDEAELVFRRAIEIDRRLPQVQRGAAGSPLQNLAVLMGHEGRYAESAATAREGITVLRAYLQPDRPDLLTAEGTYAMALLNLHRPLEAEPLLRDIASRSARVRGVEHTDTLVAQVQLAEVLIELRRFSEAERLLRPTALSLERIEGAESRYSTGAWSDYAVAACSGGDAMTGLLAAQRVDAIRTRALPVDDWHRFGAQTVVGLCLVRLQRYAEAEPLLLNAAAQLESRRGSGFYTTQLAYKTLCELYQATGRSAEAARLANKITP